MCDVVPLLSVLVLWKSASIPLPMVSPPLAMPTICGILETLAKLVRTFYQTALSLWKANPAFSAVAFLTFSVVTTLERVSVSSVEVTQAIYVPVYYTDSLGIAYVSPVFVVGYFWICFCGRWRRRC